MRKSFFLILLMLYLPAMLFASGPKVSVLTCSPGDEVYSIFGHTALRYCDEQQGIDEVFNYGYFDYDSPNFLWRFILGETDYMVGSVPFRIFLLEYRARGSEVVEQVLNLTPEQEQRLFLSLVQNCTPENRIYRYNYFYNNCTTKVRDKISEALGADSLSYGSVWSGNVTFRDEINRVTGAHAWFNYGMNLLLGADIDKPATRDEIQFLPANYCSDLDSAFVMSATGELQPFVIERNILLEAAPSTVVYNNFTPFNASLLLLLFTMVVMLCELRSKKLFWGYDIVLMLLQGLSGLLLLFMALFSQHPAVDNNWLLLVLNPLALVMQPFLVARIIKKKSLNIAWVQIAFISLFFVSAIVQCQVYPVPVYFCAIALLARSLFHIYNKKICDLSIL